MLGVYELMSRAFFILKGNNVMSKILQGKIRGKLMLHGKEVDGVNVICITEFCIYTIGCNDMGSCATRVVHNKSAGYTFEPELVEVIRNNGTHMYKGISPWTIVSETETEFCSKNVKGDLWIRDKAGYSYRPITPITPTTTLPDGRVFDTSKLNERLVGLPEEGKE